jgi:hypothetical protein
VTVLFLAIIVAAFFRCWEDGLVRRLGACACQGTANPNPDRLVRSGMDVYDVLPRAHGLSSLGGRVS